MFGEIVRAHRRRLGLSQEDLAYQAGVSAGTVGKIEAGRIALPRPVTVRLLADAFGLTGTDRDRFCTAASAEPGKTEATSPLPGRSAAPAQLPLDVHGFTGRVAELDALDAIAAPTGGRPTAVLISAVSGTAGVGKTALAVHWAHRVREQFPDGQLYVNLRGFEPTGTTMTPAEVVRRFLDALDVAPQRIPTDLDAQAALYRTLLADKRMLILLDNARDAEQIRPLLPGAPGCLVLITSRNQLTSLVAAEGAHPLPLDLLTADEAHDLVARRLGPDRVCAEPAAVEDIVASCARLPLALAIVAARAAIRPSLPLAALAAELRDTGARLDALTTGDLATDVRAVFSWSYHILTPPAARLFRLLSLHPGPDITAPAAASLTGMPPPRLPPLLSELARTHLITEHAPGRYTFHDLLRAYATDLVHRLEPDQQRHAANHRLLDHYLHTAHTAARHLHPHREPITPTPPQPGTTPETPTDYDTSMAWFTAEHPVLLAAVDHAAATGMDTHTWQLAWTLVPFLDWRGHWHDEVTTWRAAVAATGRLADPAVQARADRNLAHAYSRLGRHDDAHTLLRHALGLYRQAGDQVGQANTHLTLSGMWERQGRLAEALDHDRQALDLFRAAGHHRGQSLALGNVGWAYALLGDHQQALIYCRQALTLDQELGNRDGQAGAWDSLGYAHHHLGHHAQAITCYQCALDLFRDLGNRYQEADTLTHLGDTHQAIGDLDAARHAWRLALTILDQLDRPEAEHVRAKLHHLNHNPPAPASEHNPR